MTFSEVALGFALLLDLWVVVLALQARHSAHQALDSVRQLQEDLNRARRALQETQETLNNPMDNLALRADAALALVQQSAEAKTEVMHHRVQDHLNTIEDDARRSATDLVAHTFTEVKEGRLPLQIVVESPEDYKALLRMLRKAEILPSRGRRKNPHPNLPTPSFPAEDITAYSFLDDPCPTLPTPTPKPPKRARKT